MIRGLSLNPASQLLSFSPKVAGLEFSVQPGSRARVEIPFFSVDNPSKIFRLSVDRPTEIQNSNNSKFKNYEYNSYILLYFRMSALTWPACEITCVRFPARNSTLATSTNEISTINFPQAQYTCDASISEDRRRAGPITYAMIKKAAAATYYGVNLKSEGTHNLMMAVEHFVSKKNTFIADPRPSSLSSSYKLFTFTSNTHWVQVVKAVTAEQRKHNPSYVFPDNLQRVIKLVVVPRPLANKRKVESYCKNYLIVYFI